MSTLSWNMDFNDLDDVFWKERHVEVCSLFQRALCERWNPVLGNARALASLPMQNWFDPAVSTAIPSSLNEVAQYWRFVFSSLGMLSRYYLLPGDHEGKVYLPTLLKTMGDPINYSTVILSNALENQKTWGVENLEKFPYPNGYERQFPLEISRLDQPGDEGQKARFLINSASYRYSSAGQILNSTMNRTTPAGEYGNAGKIFVRSGGQWVKSSANYPDVITEMIDRMAAPVRGDHFRGHILNMLRDMLNAMLRTCFSTKPYFYSGYYKPFQQTFVTPVYVGFDYGGASDWGWYPGPSDVDANELSGDQVDFGNIGALGYGMRVGFGTYQPALDRSTGMWKLYNPDNLVRDVEYWAMTGIEWPEIELTPGGETSIYHGSLTQDSPNTWTRLHTEPGRTGETDFTYIADIPFSMNMVTQPLSPATAAYYVTTPALAIVQDWTNGFTLTSSTG